MTRKAKTIMAIVVACILVLGGLGGGLGWLISHNAITKRFSRANFMPTLEQVLPEAIGNSGDAVGGATPMSASIEDFSFATRTAVTIEGNNLTLDYDDVKVAANSHNQIGDLLARFDAMKKDVQKQKKHVLDNWTKRATGEGFESIKCSGNGNWSLTMYKDGRNVLLFSSYDKIKGSMTVYSEFKEGEEYIYFSNINWLADEIQGMAYAKFTDDEGMRTGELYFAQKYGDEGADGKELSIFIFEGDGDHMDLYQRGQNVKDGTEEPFTSFLAIAEGTLYGYDKNLGFYIDGKAVVDTLEQMTFAKTEHGGVAVHGEDAWGCFDEANGLHLVAKDFKTDGQATTDGYFVLIIDNDDFMAVLAVLEGYDFEVVKSDMVEDHKEAIGREGDHTDEWKQTDTGKKFENKKMAGEDIDMTNFDSMWADMWGAWEKYNGNLNAFLNALTFEDKE